jgi:HK97 family phage major capsid protein
MVPNATTLEQTLNTRTAEGLALVKKTAALCESEDREMTAEERAAINAIGDDCKTIGAKLARVKGDQALISDFERLAVEGKGRPVTAAAAATAKGPRLSLGQQFVQSEGYDFFRNGGHRSGSSWRSPSVELIDHGRFRADTLTEDPTSGGSLIVPQYLPGILPILFKRLVVADLMASGLTDSNAIIYMQETNWTSAAAPVLEGGDKPESKLTFASVTDTVRKIAHWLPVSEEMLEDVAQIASYIDARLRLGVQIEEEDQLLNGTGTAPELLGLLLRPGLAAPYARVAPVTNSDAILTQMMTIFATSFLMPDGIVMNPANWAATILTKTTTGEYLTAGPFSPIQTPTIWGVPVAVTPSAVAGTALVGAFKQGAQVFRKGGIRVEASNSHVDFFIKNLVAIRAEERLALAVYRPGAFGEVTGLA